MADLGNCSVARGQPQTWDALGVTPYTWPNVARAKASPNKVAFAPLRGAQNDHLHVVVDIPVAGTPYITVLQEGQWKAGARASGGHAYLYDFDDGIYYAHAAETGDTWRVTVSGASVTVVSLGGSAGTRSYAFAA